jgi:hypothetical protein
VILALTRRIQPVGIFAVKECASLSKKIQGKAFAMLEGLCALASFALILLVDQVYKFSLKTHSVR